MKQYILGLCLTVYSLATFSQQKNFIQYVDPFIGTGGHGHTFPGAVTPFGMVQLSPDTRIDGSWDGCSGYHNSDSVIYGFSHTHLSGTGCSDWGDILLMPMMGTHSFDNKIYSSAFSHKNEKASAGYYSVKLDDNAIDVELTATTRVGMHRYTFNKEGEANIILDLTHRDKLLEGELIKLNDSTVEVFRKSEAWARDQRVYAYICFSKPFSGLTSQTKKDKVEDQTPKNAKEVKLQGDYLKAAFTFHVKKSETILVKVALSAVDYAGAKKNMETELPLWNFEKVKKDAEALWNKELSKIEVSGSNADEIITFYTALYHCMIHPSIYSDVDHRYRGRDNQIHTAEGFDYYTVFSLWDTFRALHPLLTIIDKKRTADFINTFIKQYEQGGRLPVWELSSNETECMIGYHSVSVIADAITKGVKGFDYEKAFEACKHSALLDHFGLKAYKEKGFIETEDEAENVSRTLEYGYDDWCIAQIAKVLNKKEDYDYFMARSQGWKNVFNPETGFMQPRRNGNWVKNFDAKEVNNNFTEGNSWQYSFFTPQDVYGLIRAMGGPEQFEKKLDELFTTESKTSGREQVDISGLIGQYAHGNEPSHHMAYLYNYVGKPWKTQERVYQVLTDFYKPAPDGLIGNEDCGQMSAWYVLSAMGFYPVCPGNTDYTIGSPLFDKVKINMENHAPLYIIREGHGNEKFAPVSLKQNALFFTINPGFDFVIPGNKNITSDTLYFKTPENPSERMAIDLPANNSFQGSIIPCPVISTSSKVFDDSLRVEINPLEQGEVYYAMTASAQPDMIFKKYEHPFYISNSNSVYAYAKEDSLKSKTIAAHYFKRPNNWSIQINSKYNPQYTADGDEGIIDGLRGNVKWRKGGWQGYQGQDFECIIDLKTEKSISKISAGFLQDQGSWILMPKEAAYYISADGKNFILAATVENTVEDKDEKVQVKDFSASLQNAMKGRYVKVKATNYGKLPPWHDGAGDDAFIFIDEIMIE